MYSLDFFQAYLRLAYFSSGLLGDTMIPLPPSLIRLPIITANFFTIHQFLEVNEKITF